MSFVPRLPTRGLVTKFRSLRRAPRLLSCAKCYSTTERPSSSAPVPASKTGGPLAHLLRTSIKVRSFADIWSQRKLMIGNRTFTDFSIYAILPVTPYPWILRSRGCFRSERRFHHFPRNLTDLRRGALRSPIVGSRMLMPACCDLASHAVHVSGESKKVPVDRAGTR